jgi:Flp pilus assembly protein TadG
MTVNQQNGRRPVERRLSRFLTERKGNVAIIVALVLGVLIFGVGMGVDYTLANRRQDAINGYADAAALAAVTPNMMSKTDADAIAAAQAMFTSQMATVSNITYSPTNVVITATDTGTGNTVNRVINISYTANSTNAFAGILGMPSIPIAGSASAKSSVAPRIDFYMLLDTSPSMAIAATQAGINTMVNNTGPQLGCAFACHETNPAGDNLQNPSHITCVGDAVPNQSFPSGGEDNYALARCLGVTLRIDNVNAATTNLMSTAQTTAATNYTTYRIGISTMDYNVNQLIGLTDPNGPGGLAALQAASTNIQAVTVYDNSCLTSSNCNNDQDSALDTALSNLNGVMPNPGNGTSNPGDTPEEVLFIVSDGVNDYNVGGGRKMAPIDTVVSPDQCTSVKNRGIRIAFLYLTYYPLPTNKFYQDNISPFQPQIAAAAQNCASPGLYFEVSTGGDINAAMTALFQKAVSTAHLTR